MVRETGLATVVVDKQPEMADLIVSFQKVQSRYVTSTPIRRLIRALLTVERSIFTFSTTLDL